MDSEQMAILAKENEKIKFRVWIQEQYELQVMEWKTSVFDYLSTINKSDAKNLTMADFQPKPLPKFVAAHLDGKELKEIYLSLEHILPNKDKYAAELKYIIETYDNFRNDNAAV